MSSRTRSNLYLQHTCCREQINGCKYDHVSGREARGYTSLVKEEYAIDLWEEDGPQYPKFHQFKVEIGLELDDFGRVL